jgi:hypothetical protein
VSRLTRTAMSAAVAAALTCLMAAPGLARTFEVRYTPFAADGSLREGLRATPGFGGACTTGSFVVAGPGVFRCVAASSIYDPCYLDAAAAGAQGRPVVACVDSPWSHNVLRLRIGEPLDGRYGARADGPPWALRLASGRRCVRVSGAAAVVEGRRMNYSCGPRYLFGSPDRSRATWQIRQALTPGGVGMREVAIAAAWR